MKQFIILGGNFANTGAEAMTYVTVSELRRKHPDCKITLITHLDKNINQSKYNFDVKYMSLPAWDVVIQTYAFPYIYTRLFLKFLLHRENVFEQVKEAKQLFESADGIFDISGYAVSSQWGNEFTERKTKEMQYAHKHNIPCFYMPQSFGPFNYAKNREALIKGLKLSMSTCSSVFAREKEGFDLLVKDLGLTNVKLSTDMVLQNKGVNLSDVFTQVDAEKVDIETKNNVAIIPNMRNFDHGNKEEILTLYKNIVEYLLTEERNVYLISHSREDGEACRLIKDMFANIDEVHLFTDKVDCISFEDVIKHFDFAVASRFHSVVHSYKSNVPCVVLGWATKYKELAELFGQEQYMLDVRNLDKLDGVNKVSTMLKNCEEEEKKKLSKKLSMIQENNCFNQIDF